MDWKKLIFRGASLADLRAFPLSARREAGHQLWRVQRGLPPEDWKPLRSVGPGALEIRIREESGAFRVVYVTKWEGAVQVLHCFQKKTEKTRKADIELAAKRYRDLFLESKK
jgi:phage-related protein